MIGKTQPQVTVARKALGTLKVSKSSVTAGSMVDLEIDYEFSEAMKIPVDDQLMPDTDRDSVIEISLPVGWDGGIAPIAFNTGTSLPDAEMAKKMDGYVYLDRGR